MFDSSIFGKIIGPEKVVRNLYGSLYCSLCVLPMTKLIHVILVLIALSSKYIDSLSYTQSINVDEDSGQNVHL